MEVNPGPKRNACSVTARKSLPGSQLGSQPGELSFRVRLTREVLYSTDASHLATSLNHANNDGSAQVSPWSNKIQIGYLFASVFLGDLGLYQVEFLPNI